MSVFGHRGACFIVTCLLWVSFIVTFFSDLFIYLNIFRNFFTMILLTKKNSGVRNMPVTPMPKRFGMGAQVSIRVRPQDDDAFEVICKAVMTPPEDWEDVGRVYPLGFITGMKTFCKKLFGIKEKQKSRIWRRRGIRMIEFGASHRHAIPITSLQRNSCRGNHLTKRGRKRSISYR